jgi:heat shock protein HslJ
MIELVLPGRLCNRSLFGIYLQKAAFFNEPAKTMNVFPKISLFVTAMLTVGSLMGQEDRPEAIVGIKWQLETVRGKAVEYPENVPPAYVIFSDSIRLHGFSGCNSFSGTYRLTKDGISIRPQGMTMAVCPPGYSDRPLRSVLLLADRMVLLEGMLQLKKGEEVLGTFSAAED